MNLLENDMWNIRGFDILIKRRTECQTINSFEVEENDSNIFECRGQLNRDKSVLNQHCHGLLEASNFDIRNTESRGCF